MKRLLLFIMIFTFSFINTSVSAENVFQNRFSLEYHLYMEVEDHPRVEIRVSGLQDKFIRFHFNNGWGLGSIKDISGIFTEISVIKDDGKGIGWKWEDNKTISIENPENVSFTIKYNIDASKIARVDNSGDINKAHTDEKFVLFRNKAIYFTPSEILMMPSIEPSSITLVPHLPLNVELYSSLPCENNSFKAVKGLWGNLVNDFSIAYFVGGRKTLYDEYTGSSGNTYNYALFDWHDDYSSWFSSFGDKKAAAEKYMQTIDLFTKYYSDFIAPLPEHQIIVADQIPDGIGLPRVNGRGDWYNYIQIWPENSMVSQISHHIFHQYSFTGWFSKISIQEDGFLYEGFPAYYEQIIPDLLLGGDYFKGKLYALLMLDKRGEIYGIKNNEFHKRYNEASLKVYLLNEAIKNATSGGKNINDFSREIWSLVKDNQYPKNLSEEEIENCFSKVVGAENLSLYRNISKKTDFTIKEFSSLYKPFVSFTDKISKEYFWDNKLLFLCYMDICSALGGQWPHYGLIEHNVGSYMRGDALKGFKKYLQNLGKSEFSREDIVKAMSSVTGKEHSGFFEYWSSMDIELDPRTLPALDTWYPDRDAGYSTKYIPSMSMFAGNIPVKVVLNDKPMTFDSESFVKDGRILVPLRAIVEALAAQVDWDNHEMSITITTNSKKIKVKINDKKAYINDSEYLLDAAPEISNGRTMVPLRFISESMGCKVYWYDLVKTVFIEKK